MSTLLGPLVGKGRGVSAGERDLERVILVLGMNGRRGRDGDGTRTVLLMIGTLSSEIAEFERGMVEREVVEREVVVLEVVVLEVDVADGRRERRLIGALAGML